MSASGADDVGATISCSYPRCTHSVSSPDMLLALDLAMRMGYEECTLDGLMYCSDHPPLYTDADRAYDRHAFARDYGLREWR